LQPVLSSWKTNDDVEKIQDRRIYFGSRLGNMSNPTLIGTLLCLALSAGLAACAGPGGASASWQKAGATDATIASDTAQCRTTAQQTAARLYPLGSSNPTLGGAGMVAAQQQANTDRSSAELQFFNDCMEGRGYTRGKPAS
jgi:hypothetical protein